MRHILTSVPRRGLIAAILPVAAAFALFHAASRPDRDLAAAVAADDEPASPPEYECRWTNTRLTIDGKADETAWESAQVFENFTAHWLNRPARSATKAR